MQSPSTKADARAMGVPDRSLPLSPAEVAAGPAPCFRGYLEGYVRAVGQLDELVHPTVDPAPSTRRQGRKITLQHWFNKARAPVSLTLHPEFLLEADRLGRLDVLQPRYEACECALDALWALAQRPRRKPDPEWRTATARCRAELIALGRLEPLLALKPNAGGAGHRGLRSGGWFDSVTDGRLNVARLREASKPPRGRLKTREKVSGKWHYLIEEVCEVFPDEAASIREAKAPQEKQKAMRK